MNKKVLVSILILVVIGGIGTYFLIRNNDSNKTNQPTNNNQNQTNSENDNKDGEDNMDSNLKILVTYFSIPETDNPNKAMTQEEENSAHVVDGKVLGNTQYVALLIQEKLNTDIYRIETQVEYPLNHKTLVDQAKVEQNNNVRPVLKNPITNLDEYDVIFIGYPNWWGDLPMPLYTFLEQYDFAGKKIIPFNTHGGSGLSDTVNTITSKQPNANVESNAFSLSRNNMSDAPTRVNTWLEELGF